MFKSFSPEKQWRVPLRNAEKGSTEEGNQAGLEVFQLPINDNMIVKSHFTYIFNSANVSCVCLLLHVQVCKYVSLYAQETVQMHLHQTVTVVIHGKGSGIRNRDEGERLFSRLHTSIMFQRFTTSHQVKESRLAHFLLEKRIVSLQL